jgi:hypothetical protein
MGFFGVGNSNIVLKMFFDLNVNFYIYWSPAHLTHNTYTFFGFVQNIYEIL